MVPAGQLRRGFLYYLERERAQPYRPLLHYNNGSEIGTVYWARRLFGKPGEAEAFRRGQQAEWLQAIEAFGRELVGKRAVVVDSFAHDYEWDDENLVWQFHEGYPEGFRPTQQAAAKYGSHVGVWLSPFGGYSEKKQRLESGARQGFETYRHGLTLAGPRYFARFRAACEGMIDEYGVNHLPLAGSPCDPKNPRPTYDESEIIAEIRSFFATGVNLQELYIAPDLMTGRTWDVLAEAARWARQNAEVLVDTHAIGGDPLAGEVYGWASWTPQKAIVSLRNPDDRPAEFAFDVAQALELPAGAAATYRLKSPWREDASKPALEVRAGQPAAIRLEPFESLVFEATAVR